ncbi:MAG: hypothetical protein HN742_29565 [Lentisphaerae bacterium]|nr:hypothetical protein [Lentisphaerota bacterium]MBT4814136.1 hypothetical protein [Lentisphaerota bacterium]MBT5609046.1 hypothetical protein [Lentisphaerota bacterium]MBT7055478.1 hypothetical protein [Lentisphaerota bacterium]MBT7846057.1 hypothetical protein [Lentisphaerota bacterium]
MAKVYGTVTVNAASSGVTIEVRRNGVKETNPIPMEFPPGSGKYMYNTPVNGGAGYTTWAQCNDCDGENEEPDVGVTVGATNVKIDVPVPCTCS